MPIEVVSLHHYPVKGLRGVDLNEAELTPTGLAFDRYWMIVMPNGRMVTQRQNPALVRITTRLTGQALVLSADVGQIEVPLSSLEEDRQRAPVDVTIWRDQVTVLDEGDAVSSWLTDALQSSYPLRLVRMPPGAKRPQSNPEQLGADTSTRFADAAPLLVTNTASLDVLNGRLLENGSSSVPMDRFRPNIVVRGIGAFSEYQQALLYGARGELAIELCYPSERCIVTTIDQQVGVKDIAMQPLATLRSMNTAPGLEGACFGQNARLRSGAGMMIKVGDQLVLEPLKA